MASRPGLDKPTPEQSGAAAPNLGTEFFQSLPGAHFAPNFEQALPASGMRTERYMGVQMERGQVEDMIARSQAETKVQLTTMQSRFDSKFLEMNAKLDRMLDSIQHTNDGYGEMRQELRDTRSEVRSSRNTTIGTVVGTGLAVIALMIAIMSMVPSWVGLGQHQQEFVQAQISNAVAKAESHPVQAPATQKALPGAQ